jgi:hypothetical protein
MIKTIRIMILALLAITYLADISEAVQASANTKSYSNHSYDQTGPKEEIKGPPAPEITHNPPLEIPSFQDYYITAMINNLGGGIPLIYYRFDGDKNYLRRAFRVKPSGEFEFKILSAALTGKKLDYYIEVATGSQVLASLGDKDNPMTVKIVAPVSNSIFLWVVIGLIGVAGILYFPTIMKNSLRETRTTKPGTQKIAVGKSGRASKLHLSARGK